MEGGVCPSCGHRSLGDGATPEPEPQTMVEVPSLGTGEQEAPALRRTRVTVPGLARSTKETKETLESARALRTDEAAAAEEEDTLLSARGEAEAPDDLIGAVLLGQYQITKKLGEGGMGTAYLAEQVGVQRKAVIKVIKVGRADSEMVVKRFEREAAILASLENYHIVRLYNFGRMDDGRLFLAMEYGGDRSLEQLITAEGRLPAPRALRIIEQACEALHEAHQRGIIHRDIKPANVLVSRRDGEDWVKLVDVGIAKLLDDSEVAKRKTKLTSAGAIIGTPAYFSPEQARGADLDGRSDLYSLGCVLYELLTGALPVHADTPLGFVGAHMVEKPAAMRTKGVVVDEAAERLTLKLLAKDPAERFATARELAEACVKLRAELDTNPHPNRSSRRRWTIGAVALAAAALAFGVAWRQAKRSTPAPAAQPVAVVPQLPAPRTVAPAPPPVVTEAAVPQAQPAVRPPAKHQPAPAKPASDGADALADDLLREAATQEEARDDGAALALLERALALHPSRSLQAKALRGLARINDRQGNAKRALGYYGRLKPLAPRDEAAVIDERIKLLAEEVGQ